MRRDNDTVKVPKITMYDIDYAIYYHLTENIKPRLYENGTTIPVPVYFANGEKWAMIRSLGFMRDVNKKAMAPAIVIRRTSIAADDRLPIVDLNNYNPTYRMMPMKTMNMKWDRISGQYQRNDSIEYYMVDVPDYVRLNYELILWTDLQEQMNDLIHPILNASDHVWGDYHKFRTNVQDVSHDNVNIPGEDRLIKSTVTLQVDGYLRSEYEYQQSKIQKAYSVKTVKFLSEGTEQIIQDDLSVTDRDNARGNVADGIDPQMKNARRKIRL